MAIALVNSDGTTWYEVKVCAASLPVYGHTHSIKPRYKPPRENLFPLRRKFGAGRTINWICSLQFKPYPDIVAVPLSWSPVFALPVPQSIRVPFKPQTQGRIRRYRLCSSSQSMQPYS